MDFTQLLLSLIAGGLPADDSIFRQYFVKVIVIMLVIVLGFVVFAMYYDRKS